MGWGGGWGVGWGGLQLATRQCDSGDAFRSDHIPAFRSDRFSAFRSDYLASLTWGTSWKLTLPTFATNMKNTSKIRFKTQTELETQAESQSQYHVPNPQKTTRASRVQTRNRLGPWGTEQEITLQN